MCIQYMWPRGSNPKKPHDHKLTILAVEFHVIITAANQPLEHQPRRLPW